MKLRRAVYFSLLCILTLILLAGCSSAAPTTPIAASTAANVAAPTIAPTTAPTTVAGTPYKIGFNSSATGASASLGLPEAKTAQMIQKQINDKGGIIGPDGIPHTVTIVIYDDKSATDQDVSNVTRLITEDNVSVVVSGTSSGASVAQNSVCQENQTACISMASSIAITTDPTTHTQFKWIFKTPQPNGPAGVWQAAYLKAKNLANICILHTNDSYGSDTFASDKAAAEAQGLKVVYDSTYAATDTEFSAQIAGVKASGCKAVEIGSTPPVASLVTVAVRTALPDVTISSGHGICNASFIQGAGKAAEGVMFPCGKIVVFDQLPDSDPQKTVLKQYITDFTAFTNGDPISTFGGHAYDGIWMAANALSSLKNGMALADQRAAVRDYLETKIVNWPGISGVFNFTPTDHNGLAQDSLVFVKVQNGKWVLFPQSAW